MDTIPSIQTEGLELLLLQQFHLQLNSHFLRIVNFYTARHIQNNSCSLLLSICLLLHFVKPLLTILCITTNINKYSC